MKMRPAMGGNQRDLPLKYFLNISNLENILQSIIAQMTRPARLREARRAREIGHR
jgi:hypothetical protein